MTRFFQCEETAEWELLLPNARMYGSCIPSINAIRRKQNSVHRLRNPPWHHPVGPHPFLGIG